MDTSRETAVWLASRPRRSRLVDDRLCAGQRSPEQDVAGDEEQEDGEAACEVRSAHAVGHCLAGAGAGDGRDGERDDDRPVEAVLASAGEQCNRGVKADDDQ